MHKYTHIEQFYQVARTISHLTTSEEVPEHARVDPKVSYQGTVKLHGTNAGVICDEDGLVAQSRSRVITPDDDNMGFATFVAGKEQTEAIRDFEHKIRGWNAIGASKKLVFYGEWIGPGIQNGTALNKLPDRQWVLFAAKVVNGDESEYIDVVGHLLDEYKSANIHSVRDVRHWYLDVDFSDELDRARALNLAEKWTQEVEEMCPYGKRFGIEGMGEGIVWVPQGKHWGISELIWKSKGDKHKEVKRAKRNKPAMDPEVVESVSAFVEFAITENRLNKGLDYLREMGKPVDMKSTGDFLKWIAEDVQRECRLELQDNDITWKQVGKFVNKRALTFFKEKAQAI